MFVGAVIGGFMPLIVQWAADGYRADIEKMLDDALAGVRTLINRP